MSDREILTKLNEIDSEWRESEAAEEGSFDPLPDDDYECMVIDAEMAKSQNGNVGLNCQFEVIAGEHEGRYVYHTFWLTKANLKYVKRDLAIIGYVPETLSELPNKAKGKLMHKKVLMRVGQEEYEGRVRNRVKWFKRIEEAQAAQAETEDEDYQF